MIGHNEKHFDTVLICLSFQLIEMASGGNGKELVYKLYTVESEVFSSDPREVAVSPEPLANLIDKGSLGEGDFGFHGSGGSYNRLDGNVAI